MKRVIRIGTVVALLSCPASGASSQDTPVPIGQLPQKVAATLEARFPGANITIATKTIENGEVIYDARSKRPWKSS